MLVLTDVHYPGWKARVDGRSVPLERVNYLLKGVPLAAGDHSVELRYEPASWRAGWIVSLLGCLILVALTALGLREPAEGEVQVIDAVRRGYAGLRRRPVLAAALIYALLALVFFGPALAPGKTLSNSDMLWFQPPWAGVKPAELEAAGQPRARRRSGAAAAVRPLRRRPDPGDAALESLHGGRPPVPGQRPVGHLLRLQPARLRAAVLLRAGVDSAAQGVGVGVRDVPPRARAGHALRRRADRRAGLRIQPVDDHLGLLPPHERVVVDAVAAAHDGPVGAKTRPALRRRAGRSGRRPDPERPPGVQLPRAGGHRRLLRAADGAGPPRRRRRSRPGRCARRWRSGRRASPACCWPR